MKTRIGIGHVFTESPGLHGYGLWNAVSLKPGPFLREGNDMEKMEKPTKEQIIHRAYELWEQAGKPDGRDEEFYHQAEQELRNADKSSPLRTPDNL